MGPGSRDREAGGADAEEAFDLELGDILDRRPDDGNADGELALGSELQTLGADPSTALPRTVTPHDLEAVLLRYLRDQDEPDKP